MSQFLIDLLDKFGVVVGLAILIVIALIPLVRDKVIPALIKEREDREVFRRQVELERLASAKKTDASIAALAGYMATMTERMTVILNNQATIQDRENDILEALNNGISAMRERVARSEGIEQGRRLHKPGDTDELRAQDKKP
jgi:hypothetical protein